MLETCAKLCVGIMRDHFTAQNYWTSWSIPLSYIAWSIMLKKKSMLNFTQERIPQLHYSV